MLTSTLLCFDSPSPDAWSFAPDLGIEVSVRTSIDDLREPWWRYLVRPPIAAVELRWEWSGDPEMQEGAVGEIAYRLAAPTRCGSFQRVRDPLAVIDVTALAAGLVANDQAAVQMLEVASTLRFEALSIFRAAVLRLEPSLEPLFVATSRRSG